MWKWFLKRSKPVKILITAGVVLAITLLLYISIRSIKYRHYLEINLMEYMPDSAEIVIKVSKLKENISQLQNSKAYKTLAQKIPEDEAIQRHLQRLSSSLKVNLTTNTFQGHDILRFIGTDLCVGLWQEPADTNINFFACTKLSYFDYMLLPIASLFISRFAAEHNEKGTRFYSIDTGQGKNYFLVHSSVIFITNQKSRLFQIKPKKVKKIDSWNKFVFNLRQKGELTEIVKDFFNTFPYTYIFNFIDTNQLTSLELSLNFKDDKLIMETFIAAPELNVAASLPPAENVLGYLPSKSFYVQPFKASAADMWGRVRRIVHQWQTEGAFTNFYQNSLRDIVNWLDQRGFEYRVLTYLKSGGLILMGSQRGYTPMTGEDTFMAVAVVFFADSHTSAIRAFTELETITNSILGENPQTGAIMSVDFKGAVIKYIPPKAYAYREIIHPVFAVMGDSLFVSNNIDFVKEIVNARVEQDNMVERHFHNQKFFQQALKDIDNLNLEGFLDKNSTCWGFLYYPHLLEGLSGLCPIVARDTTDTEDTAVRENQRIRAEKLQKGEPIIENEIIQLTRQRIEELVKQKEQAIKDATRIFHYLDWSAYEVTHAKGGVVMKIVTEFK